MTTDKDGKIGLPREFGGRISIRLGEIGMSQRTLAQILKVSEGTISRWIGGTRVPSTARLFGLASVLGVTTDWLVGLKDERGEGP